tara:strand:- start:7097 stop:9013 length:1917 start_codon:yes stop_codon:yes gene_type:complete
LKINPLLLLFPLGVAVWFIYSQGLSGAFYYDDQGNLFGLENIVDATSFWQFVSSGEAGPLKRPVSLLTFALQSKHWPQPYWFLVVNVLIHIANALLLFFISNLILAQSLSKKALLQGSWISLAAVALWALLPLNVSTTLITIQRMTSLSATLGLAGILAYMLLYQVYRTRSVLAAFMLQFGVLGFFVGIAVFAKESAALVIVFVLVLEVTVLRSRSVELPGYKYRVLALSSALTLLLLYLSPLNLDWFTYSEYRGFSRLQRVATEWVILWDYLRSAFIPIPSQFSPFHDDVRVIDSALQLSLAGIGWLLTILLFFLIRSKSIWPLFAVLWFLTGHLLESSSVSLELMFEHRNYLAIFGPCLAIVAMSKDLPVRFQSSYRLSLGLYVSYIAFICYMTTSLWGQPRLAAEMWSMANPSSSRAALHLANLDDEQHDLGINSQNHIGRKNYKISALDRTISACEKCTAVKVQALLLACNIRSSQELRARFNNALDSADKGRAMRPLVDAMFPLIALTANDQCSELTLKDVQALIKKIEINPLARDPHYASRLAYQSAEAAYRLQNIELASTELLRAENKDPSAIPVLEFQVHIALERQAFGQALDAVARRRVYAGKGLFLSNSYLNDIESEIKKLRQDELNK